MAYKILLIESDAALAEETRVPLTDAGFEVVLAEGSEAGLTALHESRPDLAMVDAILPGDDALDLCHELKGAAGGSIPVIVLGNANSEGSPELSDPNGLGCDEYVRRPVGGDELVALCNKLIESVESLDLAGAGFDSALDELDAELDDQLPVEEEDPLEDEESDGEEAGELLSFRSVDDPSDDPAEPTEEPGVSDSLRESLEAFEEEENRFSFGDGSTKSAAMAEAAGLDMNTILEQLESSEPEPAPALVEPSAATPEGPGVDPFAQAEEIGHHIDDLFGADPRTPVDGGGASAPANSDAAAPELLGIDDDLVVWEGSSAAPPRVQAPSAAQFADPFGEEPEPPAAIDFSIPPPVGAESLPGATPFTAHGMDEGEVEFAVDGMDEPSSDGSMGLKVAAAAILLAAAGGAAFWLLPSEPAAPVDPARSASTGTSNPAPRPIGLPVRPTDPTKLSVFKQGAADAAVRDAMFNVVAPSLVALQAPSGVAAEIRPAAPTPIPVPKPAVKQPAKAEPPAPTAAAKPVVAKPEPKPKPELKPEPKAVVVAKPLEAIEPPQSLPSAADRYALLADSLAEAAALPGNTDSRVVYSEDLSVPVTLQPIPGSEFVAPRLVSRPDPKFPADLVRQSAGQSIVLRVHIDGTGKVIRIVVQEGERDGILTARAIAAVLQSEYEPATIAEGSVKAWVLETFSF